MSSTISHLPENVLKVLFQSLNTQDLKHCALVKKQWRDLINKEIGFNVIVGVHRHISLAWLQQLQLQQPEIQDQFPDISRNHPISIISKIGIQSCRVDNLKKNEKVFPFKYGQLLKTLILDGKMCNTQWNIILETLVNLSTLTISQFTLLHLELKDGCWLEFPNLRSLIVTGKPSTFTQCHGRSSWFKQCRNIKSNWKHLISNTVYLFKLAKTPRIQEIVLQAFKVQSSKQQDLVFMYMCRFIIKHKTTMKKLSFAIQQEREGVLPSINSRLEKSLDMELQRLRAELAGLALESIFVQSTRVESSRIQQTLRIILESQLKLKHVVCKFHGDVIHGFCPELVTSNYESLETIEMSTNPEQEYIDCEAFTNCTSLKYLTLIRGNRTAAPEGNPAKPETLFMNANLLPTTSLDSIRICGLQVSCENARLISELQLNLLEFKNIGDSNGFGLTIQALQNVFLNRNVQILILCNCLNNENFVVGGGFVTVAIQSVMAKVQDRDGLLLQLVANNYVQVVANVRHDDSYYEYRNCPRSAYFKNLSLQFPISIADPLSQHGLYEIGLEILPLNIAPNFGEQFQEDLLYQLLNEIPVVEETLNNSDDEEAEGQNADHPEAESTDEEQEAVVESDSGSAMSESEDASDSDSN